ncbi:hypothetical protein PMSM_27645 [Paenibacillus macquariensis subsp. macquariensis]|uniref:Transposase, Mutator family n=1 Tax=Paenibacillus macquariensis TaxID=948756 RepID=A0ABY1K0F4_9BACL|nr:hypothetical protein PMSM_27645 [Paenibacillus macquariensis subsp. macquariensis]SIR08041.1 Transposase, Mutator family [Paenibacillus macquariensis]
MPEIANLIEKMYGHHYRPQTVFNLTRVMFEHVDAFMKRPFKKRYVCVYIDSTYIAVKHETFLKRLSILPWDFVRMVLIYAIAPTESAYI